MPVYDRYWRLGAALLLFLPAGGAGIVVWYTLTGQPLERLFGSSITYSNTCQAVGAVLMLITAISQTMAARKRDRARHAALRGDLDAMPLSRVVPGATATAMNATTVEMLTARGTLSADGVGLHVRGAYGRQRTASVPWGEARLLEVWLSGTGQQRARGFTLYGERAKVEWSLPRGRHERTQKQSDIEAALLAAIHAHTGLAPRTLATSLRIPDPQPVARTPLKPLGVGLVVVCALLPFVAAVASMRLPLTTEPALNAYAAASLALIGLGLVVAAVLMLKEGFDRVPLPDAAAILPPGMPPPYTTGAGVYTLRWRVPGRIRLGEAALGMLLSGNVVPLIAVMVGSGPANEVSLILNFALGGEVLLGVLLLADAVRSGRHTITAEATGLRAGRRTLLWSDVEEVVARVPGRTVADFKVVGGDGDVTIDWPAKVRVTPIPGAQAVTPSELAALVVARSGKALRVED